MKLPSDDRVPLARAYHRASRAMTIAIGMVLPGFVGYWLDSRLGSRAVLTILGFALGITFGIWQLLRFAGPAKDKERGDGPSGET